MLVRAFAFILSSFCISVISLGAQAQPAQPIIPRSVVVRPIFVPVKAEYKHMRLQPLPMANGQIDRKTLLMRIFTSDESILQTVPESGRTKLQEVIGLVARKDGDGAAKAFGQLIVGMKDVTGSMDIEELVEYIMMKGSADADREMREMLQEMNSVLDAKRKMREYAAQTKRMRDACKQSIVNCDARFTGVLEAQLKRLEDNMDSLSELDQMTAIRLQMVMDRMQKFVETISNICKKMNDTATSIIGNLK